MSDRNLDSHSPLAGADRAFRRVLLLESDRLIKQLVVEWLDIAGFETLCASDLASAGRIATAGCDVMLADVPAPFRSAREAVIRLTHAAPNTPMIVMSADVLAWGPSASKAIARELGVEAVLVKPFTKDALINAIDRVRMTRRGPYEAAWRIS